MKKIYYLLTAVTVLFASCDPLSQTYKSLDAIPNTTAIKVTLSTADYALLATTVYANKTAYFKSSTDANLYVPTILNAKYPTSANTTRATVTFALAPSSSNVAVPDSTYTHVAYTLLAADYVFPATTLPSGIAVPANTFPDLSASGIINYLNYKYPTPAVNQLAVLTYVYFESGGTPSAGATQTDSFLYLSTGWTKVYTVSNAQYASVNRGTNNWFLATDIANIASYVNTFLKADPIVSATAKAGDTKYVSYRYTTTYQKIITMSFDGTNWSEKQTLLYLKLGGTWVPDPTIYITEPDAVTADYTYLATTTIGTASARSNLAQYGDFSLSSGYWTDADIQTAFAAILLHRITTPIIGVPYAISYYVYSGSTTLATKTYIYDGTQFNFAY